MKRSQFKKIISTMNERLEHGCQNHGCAIKEPEGMGTNGKCRCTSETSPVTSGGSWSRWKANPNGRRKNEYIPKS